MNSVILRISDELVAEVRKIWPSAYGHVVLLDKTWSYIYIYLNVSDADKFAVGREGILGILSKCLDTVIGDESIMSLVDSRQLGIATGALIGPAEQFYCAFRMRNEFAHTFVI